MEYQADSDALIPKGIIALVLKLYNGEKPEEILKFQQNLSLKSDYA
ncbi:MAG: SufE family protein [Saprospiraceae bacterium]